MQAAISVSWRGKVRVRDGAAGGLP